MTSRTLWINLEYLSAESWIEGCHKLPSFQNNGVNKYFFFPGFTNKTGGLNFEENYPLITYDYARHKVQELLQLPVSSIDRFTVQIFTYETPQLFPLLSAILKHHPDTIFLLPEDAVPNIYLKPEPQILKNFKLCTLMLFGMHSPCNNKKHTAISLKPVISM